MALTTSRSQDYTQLGYNIIPGVPKAGYTPVVGHLLKRDASLPDCWDLSVDGNTPTGLCESINNLNGTISVVLLIPGTSIILERSGAVTLGHSVQTTANPALGTVVARSLVKDAAAGSGLGVITAIDPRGANTVEVNV